MKLNKSEMWVWVQMSATTLQSPHTRRTAAHLLSVVDKILIACAGVAMVIIAEECWTDKLMGHKFPLSGNRVC